MNATYLPIILVAATSFVGLGLMTAAFVMIARRGGWQQAMQADAQGRWPQPRYLMAAGASLCCLFALLASIPGVLPWRDSSPRNLLFTALGAVLAAALVGLMAVVQRRRGR